MKMYSPERRSARIMAIAAKRQMSTRSVKGVDGNEYGAVNRDGVFSGGFDDRHRPGDLARRVVRYVMCDRSKWSKADRRQTLITIHGMLRG